MKQDLCHFYCYLSSYYLPLLVLVLVLVLVLSLLERHFDSVPSFDPGSHCRPARDRRLGSPLSTGYFSPRTLILAQYRPGPRHHLIYDFAQTTFSLALGSNFGQNFALPLSSSRPFGIPLRHASAPRTLSICCHQSPTPVAAVAVLDEALAMTTKVVATINSSGRQAASFVRAASAVGWHVRAQIRKSDGLVADELATLPNVELIEGDLTGPGRTELLTRLFSGAKIAFINTTHWGDEVAIGKACADAAKRARVLHLIYSSMPDHSAFGREWRALPMWASKFAIENYIRQIGIPATFVYTGIYNNNFTSLPYPLFQMELQDDGSFVWQAPFHPDDPLPWLDAEHDVGPSILQIFKMGPNHWKGQRVTLAFERLTPVQCCARFARGVGRPVRYVHAAIKIQVSIPSGYREQLEILQETLGEKRAPYFGPHLEYPREGRSIWEGHRGIEAYAREVFPIEEYANGLRWMDEDVMDQAEMAMASASLDENGESTGPSSRVGSRPITPAGHRSTPLHVTGAYTARSHPEGIEDDFFVGSC